MRLNVNIPWIDVMDERTKQEVERRWLEKAWRIAKDERCHPGQRDAAQRYIDRKQSNTELAIDPTCEEAYRRYQEAYANVVYIKVGGMRLPKRVRPVAVCNDTQMRKIFKLYATWPDILTAMRRCVGCIGNEVIDEKNYLKRWEQEVYT